jgi:hypothetical protein
VKNLDFTGYGRLRGRGLVPRLCLRGMHLIRGARKIEVGGQSMQNGSIMRSERRRGPDVWEYRWREPGADGKRKHRLATCVALIVSFAQAASAANILIGDAKSQPESLTMAPGGVLIVGSASRHTSIRCVRVQAPPRNLSMPAPKAPARFSSACWRMQPIIRCGHVS